jgi:hypothetical protein
MMKKIMYILAALTAVVGTCITAPGTASASVQSDFMWNTDQATPAQILCAAENGSTADSDVLMVTPHTCAFDVNPTPAWFIPTSATGQIKLAGTNLCLQQDDEYDPNIILNTCGLPAGDGGAAEEWIPSYITNSPWLTYSFRNAYTNGCLNDDYYLGNLNVTPCEDDFDQFFQSPYY